MPSRCTRGTSLDFEWRRRTDLKTRQASSSQSRSVRFFIDDDDYDEDDDDDDDDEDDDVDDEEEEGPEDTSSKLLSIPFTEVFSIVTMMQC